MGEWKNIFECRDTIFKCIILNGKRIRWDFAFVIFVPIFLLFFGKSWVFNRIDDPDVWFYHGHFLDLFAFSHIDAGITQNYYQTRLPYNFIGFLFYHIFSDDFAPYAFMMFIYSSIAFSSYYVMRANLAGHVAFVVTVLLVTDVFFIRAVGWQYVDNGVLLYQLLSIATLTAASRMPAGGLPRNALIAASAFLGASMILIHVGSALVVPLVISYGFYVFRGKTSGTREYIVMFVWACLGAALCQLLYGILNIYIFGERFFFVMSQIVIGKIELERMTQALPMSYLLQEAYWLSMFAAVLGCSVVLLIMDFLKKIELSGFQRYILCSLIIVYSIVVFLELARKGIYLARIGHYVSFFIFFNYLGIGAIMSKTLRRNWISLVFVPVLLLAFAGLKVAGSGTFGLALGIWMPMWAVAFVAACLLAAPEILRLKSASAICVVGIGIVGLFNPWHFERDDSILNAHRVVKEMVGRSMPILFYNAEEKDLRPIFTSIVASFTEKAWVLHGDSFPRLHDRIRSGDRVIVMSRKWERSEDVRDALLKWMDEALPLGSMWIRRAEGGFWIHGFEVQNAVGLPVSITDATLEKANLPASAFPSLVGEVQDGERVAHEGRDKPGVLLFGPYARLEKGGYEVVFRYRATGTSHSWDIVHHRDGAEVRIDQGAFPDTRGELSEVTVELQLDQPVESFETRAFFSGQGELAIDSIGIVPAH